MAQRPTGQSQQHCRRSNDYRSGRRGHKGESETEAEDLMEGAELGALARVFWGFPVLQILSFTVEQLDERTRPGRPAPRCYLRAARMAKTSCNPFLIGSRS